MPDVLGIDISYHQTKTPSLTGLAFLFARASIGVTGDLAYAKHIAAAKQAGLVTGAYHFGVNASASLQAATFLHAAGDVDFYALDLEGANPMTTAQARAFIAAVQQAGHECGLYHSQSGFPNLGQDWNWVASWGNPPTSAWRFWQYRGSPLDLDVFNGTLAELLGTQSGPNQGDSMVTVTLTPFEPRAFHVKAGQRIDGYEPNISSPTKTSPSASTWGAHADAFVSIEQSPDPTATPHGSPFLRVVDGSFKGLYIAAAYVTLDPAPVVAPADCSAQDAAIAQLEAQIVLLEAKVGAQHEATRAIDIKTLQELP